MNNKPKLTPCTCFSHDGTEGHLKIEVEMPGINKINKNDIKLEMRKNSFCVLASRKNSADP